MTGFTFHAVPPLIAEALNAALLSDDIEFIEASIRAAEHVLGGNSTEIVKNIDLGLKRTLTRLERHADLSVIEQHFDQRKADLLAACRPILERMARSMEDKARAVVKRGDQVDPQRIAVPYVNELKQAIQAVAQASFEIGRAHVRNEARSQGVHLPADVSLDTESGKTQDRDENGRYSDGSGGGSGSRVASLDAPFPVENNPRAYRFAERLASGNLLPADDVTLPDGREVSLSSYGDAVPGGYNGGWTLTDKTDGQQIGKISYQYAKGQDPLIAWIEASPGRRGRGVSEALASRLMAEFPGQQIDPGMLTDDGARWWARVKDRINPPVRRSTNTKLTDDWDESLHPRDEDGKFAEGGGGGGDDAALDRSAARTRAKEPGYYPQSDMSLPRELRIAMRANLQSQRAQREHTQASNRHMRGEITDAELAKSARAATEASNRLLQVPAAGKVLFSQWVAKLSGGRVSDFGDVEDDIKHMSRRNLDWDESLHPREEDGKFAESGGGDGENGGVDRVAGWAGPRTDADKEHYEALRAEAAALSGAGAAMSGGGMIGLTRDQAARFEAVTREMQELLYDHAPAMDVANIKPPTERQSTLAVDTVAVARSDLRSNKAAFMAISDAANGVYFNAETPVDDIMRGKNSHISPERFYHTFDATRAAMREQYGDTITLYRAVGQQRDKPTLNWATTREFAESFGPGRVTSRVFKIEEVLAVNVGLRGDYHEVIVGTPPKTEGRSSRKLTDRVNLALRRPMTLERMERILEQKAVSLAGVAQVRMKADFAIRILNAPREMTEDDMLDMINGLVGGAERTIAASSGTIVIDTTGMGRGFEAGRIGAKVAQYSAIMDSETCDPCEVLDGEEFEVDDLEYEENMPPNQNCEGGDNCRCMYFYDFLDEANLSDWDESLHPRDGDGKFTDGGSVGGSPESIRLPRVPSGHVRLYRGMGSTQRVPNPDHFDKLGQSTKGRFFTPFRGSAERYGRYATAYVDVPENELEQSLFYHNTTTGYKEYVLPEDKVATAKIYWRAVPDEKREQLLAGLGITLEHTKHMSRRNLDWDESL